MLGAGVQMQILLAFLVGQCSCHPGLSQIGELLQIQGEDSGDAVVLANRDQLISIWRESNHGY